MTVEPRVEDLLASIRKAIDSDLGGLARGGSSISENSHGTLMRGAIREMRVSFDNTIVNSKKADSEIAELRNRITRGRIEKTVVVPKISPAPLTIARLAPHSPPGSMSEILTGQGRRLPALPVLRQTLVEEEPYIAPQVYAPEVYAPEAYAPEVYREEWTDPEVYAPPPPDEHYPPQDYAPPQQALVSPQTAYSAQASFQNLADSIMARATGDRSIEDMTRDLLRGMLKSWLDDNLPDLVEKLVREEIERVARRGR